MATLVGPPDREKEMAKHEQEESKREHARDSDRLIVQGVAPSAPSPDRRDHQRKTGNNLRLARPA